MHTPFPLARDRTYVYFRLEEVATRSVEHWANAHVGRRLREVENDARRKLPETTPGREEKRLAKTAWVGMPMIGQGVALHSRPSCARSRCRHFALAGYTNMRVQKC